MQTVESENNIAGLTMIYPFEFVNFLTLILFIVIYDFDHSYKKR